MLMEQSQANYQIKDIDLYMKQRNLDHMNCLSMLKYVFIFMTTITLYKYYKSVSYACLKLCYRFRISKSMT